MARARHGPLAKGNHNLSVTTIFLFATFCCRILTAVSMVSLSIVLVGYDQLKYEILNRKF